MAHPDDLEAGDAPVDTMDSAAAAFDKMFTADGEPRDDQRDDAGDEDQSDDQVGDDLDLSEDEDDGDDEPQQAAIEAPASLNAEEKAAFAAASPEAQRAWAAAEARRNGDVQRATTKASEAQRNAESAAARADATAKAVYAQQLQAFADQLAPQRPDPQLAMTDPAAFIALNAQYEAAKAQHDQFVQQVTALGTEAEQQMTQAEIAERDAALMAIPEVQNEETRNAFFEKGIETAKALGLDLAGLNSATAGEWKALRTVSEWKSDAEKYRAAMARQMQRVREGKNRTAAKPNAAQRSSSEGRGTREAKDRLRQSGSLQDAAAALAGRFG